MNTIYDIEMLKNLAKNVPSGRRQILTNKIPDTPEKVLEIVQDAMSIHELNRAEIFRLTQHYLGVHNIYGRAPVYTSDVNNKITINYAYSIVRDIVGYTFGKAIEYVHKDVSKADKVRELTSILDFEDAPLEDTSTAVWCSICGVGYQCVLASDDYGDNAKTGIKIGTLNPLNTFVVQSYDFKNPIVLSCTYYETKEDKIYTVYTNTGMKYIIKNLDTIDEGTPIATNMPIIMIENNQFRLGDFETALSILDAIDQVGSDSVNDIENFVQSLLVLINASLGDTEQEREENRGNIKKNRLIELHSPQGLQADAKYITQQLNPETTKTVREYLEETLWKVVGIPDRKTRGGGGGDTGDAVKLRDGWADIEVVARNKEKFFRKAKKDELDLIIEILSPINETIKNLKARDIEIKFSRNKNDNMQSKAQSYQTLVATKTIAPQDALDIVDITTNVNEVTERGEKYWNEKAEEEITKQTEQIRQSQQVVEDNNGGRDNGNKESEETK